MGAKGFLGTNASVLADITLVLSILVAITLTIWFWPKNLHPTPEPVIE